VGASWAEAPARQASELRQINTCSRLAVSRRLSCVGTGHGGTAPWLQLGIAVETIEDLIIELRDWLLRHWTVDFVEAIHDLSNLEPPRWRFF
jgi:hypothetical protein